MTLNYNNFFDVMEEIPNHAFKGDEVLRVRFFKKVETDDSVALDNGKYLTYLADFIEIVIPNEAGIPNVICRAVTPSDIMRYKKQWKIYQASENKDEDSKQLVGFPLNEWAFVTKKQCDMLSAMGYDTVNQVASMSDTNATAITSSIGINGLVLKDKANNFLLQRKVMNSITDEVKKSIKEDESIQPVNQQSNKLSRYSKPSA
jgi:hypothetical protein